MAVLPVATPTGTKTSNKIINFIFVLWAYFVVFQLSGYFCNVVSFHQIILGLRIKILLHNHTTCFARVFSHRTPTDIY